jgi:hypothetical protein
MSELAEFDGVSEGERVINGNLQKLGPRVLVQPMVRDSCLMALFSLCAPAARMRWRRAT